MFITLIYRYITISWVSFTFTSAGILLGHFLRGMSNTPAHTALPKCNSRKKVSLDRRLLRYIPLSKGTFRKSFRRHSIAPLQPTFHSSSPNQLILPKQHLTPSCDRGTMLAPQAKSLSFWKTKRACQPQQQSRKTKPFPEQTINIPKKKRRKTQRKQLQPFSKTTQSSEMMAPQQSPPLSHKPPWVTNNASDSERASCPGGYTDDRRHRTQTTWAGSGAGVDGAACCTHGSWTGRTAHRWTPDQLRQPLPCHRRRCRHRCWEPALWRTVVGAAWDERNLWKWTDQFASATATVFIGRRQALRLHPRQMPYVVLGTSIAPSFNWAKQVAVNGQHEQDRALLSYCSLTALFFCLVQTRHFFLQTSNTS